MTLKPESLGKKSEHIITKNIEMKKHKSVNTKKIQCPVDSVFRKEQIELNNFSKLFFKKIHNQKPRSDTRPVYCAVSVGRFYGISKSMC